MIFGTRGLTNSIRPLNRQYLSTRLLPVLHTQKLSISVAERSFSLLYWIEML